MSLLAFIAILAVLFFGLAGTNVRSPRFAPEWWGFACLAIVICSPVLAQLTR